MRRLLGVAATTLAAVLALSSAALTTEKDASDRVVSNETKIESPESKAATEPQPGAEIRPVSEASPVIQDPFALALKAKLAEVPRGSAGGDKADRAALAAFYEDRQHKSLWTSAAGFSPRAEALIDEIEQARDWGLKTSDFALPTLPPDAGKEQLADAEVALGMAALKYARQARGGRLDPASLTKFLDRSPPVLAPKTVLEQIALAENPGSYLRGLHPQHPQFERLRQKYLEMRKSSPVVTSAAKVPDGPKLAPGSRHPHVALVRSRLGLASTGNSDDGAFYDDVLVKAVREFQAARGLKLRDGVVDAPTRQALNTIETGSARRLLSNMEQWRWMPEKLGEYYVWVNIPEFTIRVVQNGRVIHAERIVVGKVDSQTPIFSDEVEQVIFHPFWGVPDSIKRLELQPNLAAGGGILARQGLRVQYRGREVEPESIDWRAMDMRNVHIYQPPGPSNVLGVVKFRFPNKHDVYFHDTPQKHLFSAAVRTFSHGCMRVQNPVRLAELLLAHDKNMSSDRVRGLTSPGAPKDNQVNLTTRIPVHITYFTASVDDNGTASYRSDIYGHEERIALGLEGKMNLIAKVREPTASARVADRGPSDSGTAPAWLRSIFNF
ncbi:MAG: L,D-transpeptidase family protein [Hyphomicrobiaceae bacterium]